MSLLKITLDNKSITHRAFFCSLLGFVLLSITLPDFAVFSPTSNIQSTVHMSLEMFSIVISTLVVVMAFHGVSHNFSNVANTLIIGFTAIAGLDLVHALSYDGFPLMNSDNVVQRAVFFWFAGRWVELITFILVVAQVNFAVGRTSAVIIGFAIVLLALYVGTVQSNILPDFYLNNEGVTQLKSQIEYVLVAGFMIVAFITYKKFKKEKNKWHIYFAYSCFLMALCELALSHYSNVGDFTNLLGHILKICSFLLVYKATFLVAIREPYQLLVTSQKELAEQKADLQTLLRNLPLGVLQLDKNLNCLYLNQTISFVPEADSVLGKRVTDFLPKDFVEIFYSKLYEVLAGRKIEFNYQYQQDCKDVLNIVTMVPTLDANQTVKGIILLVSDVTEREKSQRQLVASLQEIADLQAALDAHAIVAVTDARGNITRVNDKFCSISKYSAQELIGKNHNIINSGYHPSSFFSELWKTISQGNVWNGEICNRAKDGSLYWVYTTIVPFLDNAGSPLQYVAIRADITNRKIAEQKAQRMAFYDELTGLPNRRLILERLSREVTASARKQRYSALLLLDLDFFKEVNDTLGHTLGDELLRQVAVRLSHYVHKSDTVARLGGDEFVVILTELAEDMDTASRCAGDHAERIRDCLSVSYEIAGQKVNTSTSIGIVLFQGSDEESEELLKQVDMALYKAKDAGRNRVQFFDHSLQQEITERAKLINELRQSVENEELRLFYQPIVDMQRQVVGVEALVRWQHPTKGLVGPISFISIAEQTNLILPIGQWVLKTACMQLQNWESDPVKRYWTIAVNVSAKQFQDVQFVDKVKQVIRQSGANPKLLRIELTESLMHKDLNQTIGKMLTLQQIGIRFSLDDFGTGYSSLSYLKKLPLDLIKIDRSFICDAMNNPKDTAIIRTILLLASDLGFVTVAEGIENDEQFQFLLSQGCQNFQGYLFGKPEPVTFY